MSLLLFVYGTLMVGEPNHRYLAAAKLVGRAMTVPGFELLDLGHFPAMVPARDAACVWGEIFEVDAATLARCDKLEGHPNFYRRTPIALSVGRQRRAETYLFVRRQANDLVIGEGDWRAYRARKTSCGVCGRVHEGVGHPSGSGAAGCGR
jgi:gamma-glutamylaminecyclotransferase